MNHLVGYSKSARAKCHGPPPCKNSPVETGSLRYGKLITADFGDSIEWRHWGCVTPDILAELATVNLDQIKEFPSLRPEDQQKIRTAIHNRRIDPADIPPSARPPAPTPVSPATQSAPSQKQRRALRDAAATNPHSSAANTSAPIVPATLPPAVALSPVVVPSSQGPPSQKQRRALRDAAAAASSVATPSTTAMPTSSSQVSSSQGISSQAQRRAATAATKASPNKRKLPHDSGSQATSSAMPSSSQALAPVEDEALEEETHEELYTSMRTNVVGIQYYKGLVGPGEEVILQREPHNAYDRNAIQVLNISRTQVGHIPKNVAQKLAPLLDQRLVNCEAIIHDGNLSGFRGYTLDLTIRFYAAADKRALIQPKLIWATPGQRGFGQTTRANAPSYVPPPQVSYSSGGSASAAGSSQQRKSHVTANTKAQIEAALKQEEARKKAAELSRILNTLEKVDDEGRRSSLLDSVCASEDVLNLPLHPDPPGIAKGDLVVDLMKHQSQGLQWCIEREYPVLPKKESDKPVQFWQLRQNPAKKSNYYFNIATKTPMAAPPVLGRGALFADAMGLGKTLTMIALVLATKKDKPAHFSNATLIVVPLSILSNWEKQIQDHCSPGALKAHVYYGPGRSVSAEDLGQFDMVITTYQVCVTEHTDFKPEDGPSKKKRKGGKPLFGVQWKRIILDEGHCIRNPKTKMAKAVCAIPAERRWVLTGTPIINSPRDLGSIMTFLKICQPLDQEDFFKRLLLRPLKDGTPAGAELLRALMSHICIRRTKEMQDSSGNPLIPLPPVEMTLVPVALHDDARELYDEVENLSKQRIQGYISRGEAKSMQSNVLSMLTRMRQISLHPGLVPKNYIDELRAMLDSDDKSKPRVALRPEDKARLQSQLLQAIEDSEECPICLDVPDSANARITSCAHVFCIQCITEILSRQGKCPMDRQELSIADVIEPPPPTDLTQMQYHSEEETFEGGSSAKIDQLVHLLTLLPVTEKSLVFSQFTTFLDKIAEVLDTRGIPYERFDGRMSAKKRQEVLAKFSIPIEAAKQVEEPMEVEPARARKAKASRRVVVDDSDDFPMNNLDSDFSPLPQDNSDNDDFVVSDSDDDSYTRKKLKGKGKAKPKSKSKGKTFLEREDLAFGSGENPKVLLLSLKAGALGLNLTVANNVFLMDPWWQEGIESQAIDRVNRIGQKKDVHVYQLIAENTVEAKVLDIQEKKKALIKQAFSGTKRTETPLQRKEARLQEIVELFGLRNSQVPPVLD
ncbi:hypothetical protein BDZ89DRAFT_1068783 [Hymenopellis radicata]|nr:hypothetical protein BDZ89DRAFT_1068783 [Hymenopellis radicata]